MFCSWDRDCSDPRLVLGSQDVDGDVLEFALSSASNQDDSSCLLLNTLPALLPEVVMPDPPPLLQKRITDFNIDPNLVRLARQPPMPNRCDQGVKYWSIRHTASADRCILQSFDAACSLKQSAGVSC